MDLSKKLPFGIWIQVLGSRFFQLEDYLLNEQMRCYRNNVVEGDDDEEGSMENGRCYKKGHCRSRRLEGMSSKEEIGRNIVEVEYHTRKGEENEKRKRELLSKKKRRTPMREGEGSEALAEWWLGQIPSRAEERKP
ncbi:hypothetical protein M5K25_013619 [Dendrobium thyrsiflorum]|uniref:Uncharacterized protein n=1 Tax=Dendrobium thyrsiflorum TaxID=117978 RepID=A0ABD0UTL2_DENTH